MLQGCVCYTSKSEKMFFKFERSLLNFWWCAVDLWVDCWGPSLKKAQDRFHFLQNAKIDCLPTKAGHKKEEEIQRQEHCYNNLTAVVMQLTMKAVIYGCFT